MDSQTNGATDTSVEVQANEAKDASLVDAAFGCPKCGERRMDYLPWDEDFDVVTCQSCGTTYDPATKAILIDPDDVDDECMDLLIAELALDTKAARIAVDRAKDLERTLKQELDASSIGQAMATAIEMRKTLASSLANLESRLRELGIAEYAKHPEAGKTILDGMVQITERAVVRTDYQKALAWAKEHNLYLALDTKAWDAFILSSAKLGRLEQEGITPDIASVEADYGARVMTKGIDDVVERRAADVLALRMARAEAKQ